MGASSRPQTGRDGVADVHETRRRLTGVGGGRSREDPVGRLPEYGRRRDAQLSGFSRGTPVPKQLRQPVNGTSSSPTLPKCAPPPREEASTTVVYRSGRAHGRQSDTPETLRKHENKININGTRQSLGWQGQQVLTDPLPRVVGRADNDTEVRPVVKWNTGGDGRRETPAHGPLNERQDTTVLYDVVHRRGDGRVKSSRAARRLAVGPGEKRQQHVVTPHLARTARRVRPKRCHGRRKGGGKTASPTLLPLVSRRIYAPAPKNTQASA